MQNNAYECLNTGHRISCCSCTHLSTQCFTRGSPEFTLPTTSRQLASSQVSTSGSFQTEWPRSMYSFNKTWRLLDSLHETSCMCVCTKLRLDDNYRNLHWWENSMLIFARMNILTIHIPCTHQLSKVLPKPLRKLQQLIWMNFITSQNSDLSQKAFSKSYLYWTQKTSNADMIKVYSDNSLCHISSAEEEMLCNVGIKGDTTLVQQRNQQTRKHDEGILQTTVTFRYSIVWFRWPWLAVELSQWYRKCEIGQLAQVPIWLQGKKRGVNVNWEVKAKLVWVEPIVFFKNNSYSNWYLKMRWLPPIKS